MPGGHPTVSQLHIARCVCRRTERIIVDLLIEDEDDEFLIIKYINRLSDYLFVLSRFIAKDLNAEEVRWIPRVS
jgi:cob(I)alamin adenosyltransferase